VPAQQRVRLHDEERGAPPAGRARQEDETEPVGGGARGPLDLVAQDHELLAQESVLGDEGSLRPGQIANGSPTIDPVAGLVHVRRCRWTARSAARARCLIAVAMVSNVRSSFSAATVADLPPPAPTSSFPQHSAPYGRYMSWHG